MDAAGSRSRTRSPALLRWRCSYDGPAGEREERQAERGRGDRDGQAEDDLYQLAEAAAGIAEGQPQAGGDATGRGSCGGRVSPDGSYQADARALNKTQR